MSDRDEKFQAQPRVIHIPSDEDVPSGWPALEQEWPSESKKAPLIGPTQDFPRAEVIRGEFMDMGPEELRIYMLRAALDLTTDGYHILKRAIGFLRVVAPDTYDRYKGLSEKVFAMLESIEFILEEQE